MCGRYVSPQEAELRREYLIDRRNSHLVAVKAVEEIYGQSFNVAPTDRAPVLRVVRDSDGVREAVSMRWGLIPWWSHGQPTTYSTINCRIESMETNASYRDAWKRGHRCIFPASGFYEWHVNHDGSKTPYFIKPAGEGTTFALAGLWDRATTPTNEQIESCTMITMRANDLMAQIHNHTGGKPLSRDERRMPVILQKEDVQIWLTGTPEEARAVMKEYPSEQMLAWPVSKKVNSSKNDGPALIQPNDVEQPRLL